MKRSRVILSIIVAAILMLGLMTQVAYAGKGNQPGSWSTLTSIPAGPGSASGLIEGAAIGGAGDIIVAACGWDNALADNNLVRRYNIPTDNWSAGTAAPTVRAEVAYGELTHDGKLYVIGGRTFGTGNITECYDINADSWSTLAPMPTARAAAAAAVVGNAIYVMGGRTASAPGGGGELATVERYDIATDTWSTVASLPSARSDFTAIAHGGKIYVFGGFAPGFVVIADVDVYNPTKDNWSTAPTDMPTPRASLMVGKVGNNAYVIGGRDGSGLTGVNEVYNITKDTWSTDTPMPAGQEVGETGVYSHGGGIYVIGGGQPFAGTGTNFTQLFKP